MDDKHEQFMRAYDELADAVFRHCYFRNGENREEARDVMQEAFCKTWEYIAAGNTVDNLRAFIYRVANNLIIDRARKKKPVSLELLEEAGFQPSQPGHKTVERQAELNHILKLLSKLEPLHRDVLVMRYIDDLDPREIAEILGESANAISVRIHRSMEKVKKLSEHN